MVRQTLKFHFKWIGISNGRLNDPLWHKVEKAKTRIGNVLSRMNPGFPNYLNLVSKFLLLDDELPWDAIFEVMTDPSEVSEGTELPDNGVDRHKELKYSALRIRPFLSWGSSSSSLTALLLR